jgi:hypothetical protein
MPSPLAATGRPDDACFVTHLECSATGERHDADRLHTVSRAGKSLLVRYDLEAVGRAVTRDAVAGRASDMWRWRELLPRRRAADIVSLGEPETLLLSLPAQRQTLGGQGDSGQGRGPHAERRPQRRLLRQPLRPQATASPSGRR